MTVTFSSDSIIFEGNTFSYFMSGKDIFKAEVEQPTNVGAPRTLVVESRNGQTVRVPMGSVTNQDKWTNDDAGIAFAVNAIMGVAFACCSGGGGVGIVELTGDVAAGPGVGTQAATIQPDVVDNAKMANMAESTLKGRGVGGGAGDPQDLTANQASDVLDTATDPFLRTSAYGGGDVTGPGSSTDDAIVRWNGTGGTSVQNSGITIADGATGTLSGTNTGNETAASVGTLINAAAAATPNDTDLVATAAAGGSLLKITWTNVKAFLKTYFDTLYVTPIQTSSSVAIMPPDNIAWAVPTLLTFFNAQTRWVLPVDLTYRTQVRFAMTMGSSGPALSGTKVRILYRTQAAGYSTTITDYAQLGASAQVEISILAVTNTVLTTSWINLAPGAMTTSILAVAGLDGNGATVPNFLNMYIEFR